MDLIIPKHKPHGVENSKPNEYRIWVCDECGHVFQDDEARGFDTGTEGHPCKQNCKSIWRCESHLEPYMPDMDLIKRK
jgi:hypothetical protein